MRQDFFEFKPQFKLVVIGNHKPTLRNGRDRPFMMTADPECRILGVAATGVLLSNCRFAPGYSGGPLLARASGSDKMEVVGINIGMSIKGAGQVAVAVPTPLIRWELETVGPEP